MPPRFLFRLFPWVGIPGAWVEQRLTQSGKLVLGLLVGGCLFGIDIRQTVSYQVAGLAFALLATSMILCLRWRPKLEVHRVLPQQVTTEVPTFYWLEITNHGDNLEHDLVLLDRLQTPRISYEEFQTERIAAKASASNRFDGAVGFPRWVAMRRLGRGLELKLQHLTPISPGETLRTKVEISTRRRGWIRFAAITLLRPDPLGLFRASFTVREPEQLLSLPRTFPTPQFNLQSKRLYQKGGVSLAMGVGDSQEFASLREYRAGDPRKHIHWRSFAKTGRLIVKEYQDEYFDRHCLVIDTNVPPMEKALFESVVSVGASIATGERPRDSILDVIFAGDDIIQLSEGRGLGDASLAMTFLAEAQPSHGDDFERVAETLLARSPELASVILVLGQWDEPRRKLVEQLVAQGTPSLSILLNRDSEAAGEIREFGTHRQYSARIGALAEDLANVVPAQ